MYPYQEPRREEWDRITITKVEPVVDTSIITPEIAEQMTCDALCENDMSCGGWDLDPYEQINCVRYDLRPGLTGRERCLARPENRDLCRENGDYDWDCTSAPASASCAEDYVVRLDPECTYGMDEAVEACKYTCVPGTSICDWSEEQQLCEPLRECGTQCKMWCQLCPSMLGECLCDDVTVCEAECAESQCTDAAKLECENCNWRCDSDSYPGSPVQIQLAADAAAREAAEAGAADGGAEECGPHGGHRSAVLVHRCHVLKLSQKFVEWLLRHHAVAAKRRRERRSAVLIVVGAEVEAFGAPKLRRVGIGGCGALRTVRRLRHAERPGFLVVVVW